MQKYELMVIFNPEVDDRALPNQLQRFLDLITDRKGSVDNVDTWGRRTLAYEINKKTEGIYVVVNFTADAPTVAELDRQLRLAEEVMRIKILRTDQE